MSDDLPYHYDDLDFEHLDDAEELCCRCGKFPALDDDAAEGLCADCAAWTGTGGCEYDDEDEEI